MGENKSFASLDPVLLARKGTAKPAMRAQLGTDDRTAELSDDLEELAQGQADLGWNDMGDVDNVLTFDGARNQPHRLQDKLASRYEASQRNAKSSKTKSTKAATATRRAAFTLRLDEERHLKLRLASTIRNCSAQVLVTEALDRLLDEMAEIDGLAEQISRKKNKA